MGLDFLRRTAKSSTKAWDRGKADLGIPNLFSQQPDCQARTVSCDMEVGAQAANGEHLTLMSQGSDILVVREKTPIAKVCAPPTDLLVALSRAGGCTLGRELAVVRLSCDVTSFERKGSET